MHRAFVQREKDHVKEFSRIAANTAKTYEQTSRDTVHTHVQYGSSVRQY